MARTIVPVDLSTRTARARIKPQEEPRWNSLVSGKVHLGYRRRVGERSGTWILRTRRAGRYSSIAFAAADDSIASDGVGTLSFDEARQRALELSQSERVAGSPTVEGAFQDYVKDLRARGKTTEVARTASIYLAEIADVPIAELTTSMLQSWLASVAAVSIRNGEPVSDDRVRRRKNSANRIAACLVAALNHAFRAGRVSSDAAWKRLKKFRGADAARTRYLTIDESVRLLNACDPDFRNLVRAALSTGMRFGELAALEVADLNADAATIHVRESKSGRARHVPLNTEALRFFRSLTAGRAGDELMLVRDDGEPWRHTRQARPMAAAVERARIVPRISFHGLRHSYASHAVMNGAPLPVVAVALGHTTARMTQRYAHLAPSYVADAIRRAAPVFEADASAVNVEPLRPRKGARR
jgi:integrase